MTDAKKRPVVIKLSKPTEDGGALSAKKKRTTGATKRTAKAKTTKAKPVLLSEPSNKLNPADAPLIQDTPPPQGDAVQMVTRLAARKTSWLARLFIWLFLTLLGVAISVAFWDFATGLINRNQYLGWFASSVLIAFLVVCFFVLLRELAVMARLRRVDGLRDESERLLASNDLAAVRNHSEKIARFLQGRKDISWALSRFDEIKNTPLDVPTQLAQTETILMTPLDDMARKQIEMAARQVATATAIVPLALADVVIALTVNIRMIRRIAEIYGGRTGVLGSWRLLKAVATHLIATGAVAVGDDMIGSIAGGGMLSKVSRRFGEGIINGALTARVGIGAMQVCRPMPFVANDKPKVTAMVKNALSGFFVNTK